MRYRDHILYDDKDEDIRFYQNACLIPGDGFRFDRVPQRMPALVLMDLEFAKRYKLVLRNAFYAYSMGCRDPYDQFDPSKAKMFRKKLVIALHYAFNKNHPCTFTGFEKAFEMAYITYMRNPPGENREYTNTIDGYTQTRTGTGTVQKVRTTSA